jgi:replicative DNA helicase
MSVDTSDLELDLLGLCLVSTKNSGVAIEALDGYQFSTKSLQWLWRNIRQAYQDANSIPTIKSLAFGAQTAVKNDDLFERIIEDLRTIKLKPVDPNTLKAIIPVLVNAYNKQRILETADKLITAAERNDLKEAENSLTHGLQKLNRRKDRTGNAGVVAIAKRTLSDDYDDSAAFVRTGLAWVDKRIRGIQTGHIFLAAGITGIGKSVMMIQAGQASVGCNKRVLHISTEMDQVQTTYRYLSRFTGIPEQAIRERKMTKDQKELLGAWLERNGERMDDLLRVEQVIANSGTMLDVDSAIDEMVRDGTPPTTIIIDSPDHLRSARRYNQKRDEITEVWWGVKRLAARGFAVWVTSQIAKKWELKIAPPEAVAEDYNKSRICDAFFSINWVVKNGKSTGKRILYWGKYRSGENKHLIPLKCSLDRMIMVTAPEVDA